jgi:hypothetical protein
MGDKGGKKDKEKNKQQQVTKHKQGEQKKHEQCKADPARGSETGRRSGIPSRPRMAHYATRVRR